MTSRTHHRPMDAQVIALAGVLRSAQLVDDLAMTGHCDEEKLAASLKTVLMVHPDPVKALYDHENELHPTYPTLKRIFRNRPLKKDRYLLRYFVQIIQLANSLQKKASDYSGIRGALPHPHVASLPYPEIYEAISNIYQQFISPVSPAIRVTGKSSFVDDPLTRFKLRSALLAGLHFALLWQNLGGKRWHLLLARKSLLRTVMRMEKV